MPGRLSYFGLVASDMIAGCGGGAGCKCWGKSNASNGNRDQCAWSVHLIACDEVRGKDNTGPVVDGIIDGDWHVFISPMCTLTAA
jgi:hypothetical protein